MRSTVYALDGVSLTVDAGECLGIVGESGCGKTMTVLSVMRLLPPGGHITSGKILLDGRDISALDDDAVRHVRGNEIGMIFQHPMTSLNPTMSVGDQISETVTLHRGTSQKEARERMIEVLGLVGMPRPAGRADNYPHQLSGGNGGLELAQHGKYPAAGPAELADILHAQLVNPCGPAGQLLSAQLIGQSRED